MLANKRLEIFSFESGSPVWDLRMFPMALITLFVASCELAAACWAGALLELDALALSVIVDGQDYVT
jgi:hypothetical protein